MGNRGGEPRVPWGTLTKDAIVDAAAAAIEEDGLEALTIRSLARRMGSSPMAIYRHVKDKDDLVFQVADKLIGRRWRPRVDRSDWQAWMIELCQRMRRLMKRHPVVLYAALYHPLAMNPCGREMRETALEVVADQLGPVEAWRVIGVIMSYTIGFSALTAAREDWLEQHPEAREEALRVTMSAANQADGFEYGLTTLVRGLGA